ETGNTTLTTRVWRMLHLDADPLVNNSSARFRLRLRDVDDAFWRANIMEELLPASFHFTGLAAADAHAAGDGGDGTTPEVADAQAVGDGGNGTTPEVADAQAGGDGGNGTPAGALPLEAEAQWRLYNNASFMRAHLERLCAQDGFNLQDFMFHVLRNCYVVMMTARDEASSFNIFSTLNSRGMDLSEVDKLKADLLQVLEPAERAQCNSQWSEMENLLGCREFHRVFDHMKALAGVLEPVRTQSVLEYFTQDLSSPNTVTQIIKVALDYSRILLQLRTGRWDSALSPSGSTLSPPPPGSEALLSRLSAQSAVMNMFEDEAWVPTALEFFLQVPSPELRLRFLQSAEALQVLNELGCDAAAADARWTSVAQTLLTRPLDPEELATTVPRRTLAHLLLRAEGDHAAASSSAPRGGAPGSARTSRLQVERIVPQTPPEGSSWRRTKTQEDGNGAEDGKYWYEVQRLFWQAKLGNLVLLPLEEAGAREVASADWEAKAAFYRACGAQGAFPRFTGEVSRPGGRYSTTRFSFDECRARHTDLVAALTELYGLKPSA
ncbi:hypothetical protein FOA52_006578, partial [Chlamydomonas sp. UWO 241]